ncbi:MAG: hypothetical protein PHN83_05975 [Dysgonamonadaceae bacterium]|jgi:hypothetical protein|nr:hypothetical protein [Dysgonamonadaceae bacterium]
MKIQKVDETSGQELKLNAEKSSEQRYESLRGAFSSPRMQINPAACKRAAPPNNMK